VQPFERFTRCMMLIASDPGHVRREVDDGEDEQPDDIDEVPVPADVRDGEVPCSVEVAAPRPKLHVAEHHQPDENVHAVERRDDVEKRGVRAVADAHRFVRVFVELEGEEDEAEERCHGEPEPQAALAAALYPAFRPDHGGAARKEDRRVDERDQQLGQFRTHRRPVGSTRADVPIRGEQERKEDRFGGDEEGHAPRGRVVRARDEPRRDDGAFLGHGATAPAGSASGQNQAPNTAIPAIAATIVSASTPMRMPTNSNAIETAARNGQYDSPGMRSRASVSPVRASVWKISRSPSWGSASWAVSDVVVQSGSRLCTMGSLRKLYSSGGECVAHSSVPAFHGLSPA